MTSSKEKFRQAENLFYDSLQYNPANKKDLADEYKHEIMSRVNYLQGRANELQQKQGKSRNNKVIEALMTKLEQLENEIKSCRC